MSTFKIGCIADDFTGAGDAASFLAAGGMKTLMLIWPHVEAAVTDGYDAVVVALKSRSIAPELAVAESLAASGEHPRAYMERVTSPGGTTAAALYELEPALVDGCYDAVDAALARTAELARG